MGSDYKSFKFKKSDLGIFKSEKSGLAIKDFKKNCRIMGLTRGNFSLIDLIYSILKKIGASNVVVVTWSAGIKDANNVKWMKDSNLIRNFTLITDHSYKTRQVRYAKSVEELFGIENIRTSEIHAKFVLISNENYKVTIRTSMNLNANKTCESFELDEDEEIFDFYNEFVSFICKNQREGFVSDSATVNETLDLFFETNQDDKINWGDIKPKW
ncbi:MAG: hypothetical protein ACOC2U_03630, partial [bacterium]